MVHRRSYIRYIVNSKTSLVTKEGKEKNVLLQDLSTEGAAIIIDSPLEQGEKIEFVIHAPSILDKPVTRVAEVRWSQKIDGNMWRVGLNFGFNKVELPKFKMPDKMIMKTSAKRAVRLKVMLPVFLIFMVLLIFILLWGNLGIITLQGVSFDARGNSRALINSEFVNEGDSIDKGVEIRKINEDSVELLIGGKTKLLKLNKTLLYLQKINSRFFLRKF